MTYTSRSMFTVPIASTAYQLAKSFQNQYENPTKARQVYLNTLAVYAVDTYCQCLSIETNIEYFESLNSVTQALMDIADIEIEGIGKLECRPVLPEDEYCYIPIETWENRIGYVAVEINDSLKEATLLGFYPSLNALEMMEKINLDDFQPLDQLLEHIYRLKSAFDFLVVSNDEIVTQIKERLDAESLSTILVELERIYRLCPREEWRYAGGELLSDYIPTTTNFSFRGGTPVVDREIFDEMQPSDLQDLAEELLEKLDEIWVIDDSDESLNVESLNNPSNSERVKANQSVIISQPVVSIPGIINLSEWLQNPDRTFQDNWQTLESFLSNQEENLIFRFASVPRSRSADGETIMISETKIREIQLKEYPVALILNCQLESTGTRNIILRLYSNSQEQTQLPPGVQLIILDESGDIFDQVQAKSADNWIQLEVSGEPGERFAVKVALGEISITENFVI